MAATGGGEAGEVVWWRRLSPPRPARPALLVLPYAGGSGNIAAGLAGDERFELHGAVLPGRDRRIAEAPRTDLVGLAGALAASWPGRRPTVVYGHSFGAWLGFEVARRLEARGQAVPLLVAGAVRAPHLRSRRAELERLAGPALWQALATVVGQPPGAEALDEGVRALLEPALRADLAAMAGYTPLPAPLLGAPVLVLGGTGDTSATMDELTAWGRWTTGTCRVRSVPGGHFFIHEAPGLVDLIAESCR